MCQCGGQDATNVGIGIERDGDEYVINGSKWWITGAGSLHCKIMILMGKTDPTAEKYGQQSQILVPMNTPGLTLLRPMMAFGTFLIKRIISYFNCRVCFRDRKSCGKLLDIFGTV